MLQSEKRGSWAKSTGPAGADAVIQSFSAVTDNLLMDSDAFIHAGFNAQLEVRQVPVRIKLQLEWRRNDL